MGQVFTGNTNRSLAQLLYQQDEVTYPLGSIVTIQDPFWGTQSLIYCKAGVACPVGTLCAPQGLATSGGHCVYPVAYNGPPGAPVYVAMRDVPLNSYDWFLFQGEYVLASDADFASTAGVLQMSNVTAGMVQEVALDGGCFLAGLKPIARSSTRTLAKVCDVQGNVSGTGVGFLKPDDVDGLFMGMEAAGTGIHANAQILAIEYTSGIVALNQDNDISAAGTDLNRQQTVTFSYHNNGHTIYYNVVYFDHPHLGDRSTKIWESNYTTPGAATFVKPWGLRYIDVYMQGGGGGGGSGRRGAAGSIRGGGGGGSPGGFAAFRIWDNALAATTNLVVGAGGAGGAVPAADDTDGNVGGAGVASTFENTDSTTISAPGGLGGGAGTAAPGGAGGLATYNYPAQNQRGFLGGEGGTTSHLATPTTPTALLSAASTGGGAGGGIDVANTRRAGGASGGIAGVITVPGATGGVADGAAGGAGTAGIRYDIGAGLAGYFGIGGGGGSASAAGVPGAGAAGYATSGAGGGGSGACVNGQVGAVGGAGAGGWIKIVSIFAN
jgi:hypothetical protein